MAKAGKRVDSLTGKTVLVIDDDPYICELVELALAPAGARVCSALSGEEGLRRFDTCRPDLVILDIMMPAPNGFEVCASIAGRSRVPIIFLTALGQDQDVVRGLELGAVDYIVKPFSPKVLAARAGAALRQAARPPAGQARPIPGNGHLTLDAGQRLVWLGRKPVHLTPTEYQLLAYLLDNPDRLVPAEEIVRHIWGPEYGKSANYVHVYVSRLRRKLEPDPKQPRYLHSVHGAGYRLDLPAADL
jgi:DNA-binding response OmpR family regulator